MLAPLLAQFCESNIKGQWYLLPHKFKKVPLYRAVYAWSLGNQNVIKICPFASSFHRFMSSSHPVFIDQNMSFRRRRFHFFIFNFSNWEWNNEYDVQKGRRKKVWPPLLEHKIKVIILVILCIVLHVARDERKSFNIGTSNTSMF